MKKNRTGFVTNFCKSKGKQHLSSWKYIHNGECLAVGKQLFHKYRVMEALIRVSTACHDAVMDEDRIITRHRGGYFTTFKSKNGRKWYWNLKSGNHRIVAASPKSYGDKKEAENAAKLFQKKLG